MAPSIFVAKMGVHNTRREKKIKTKLLKVPGVVEVCASLVTGYVAIIATGDPPDALGERLAARLRRPVFLLPHFRLPPAPPVGGGHGVIPPPWPAPSFAFPAAMVGVGGGYPLHGPLPAPPAPPQPGYYYTPFSGRPGAPPPHDRPYNAPTDTFEEDDDHKKGCCCSIQ